MSADRPLVRATESRWLRASVLVVVGLWGCYQCLWHLGRANILGDEWTYVTAGWQYVHGYVGFNREHPPAAKYLFGLAQLVAGQGPLGPRTLVGLMVLGSGVVLFLWLRVAVGWWTGLLAAGLWWVTRRNVDSNRIDRLALLDPVMAMFALVSLAALWMWLRTDRRWWLVASGALMALSVTSKVSTAVLLPAVLVTVLLYRRGRTVAIGGLIWSATFAAVFLAVYLPVGMRSAIGYMLTFQGAHEATGHPTVVDGHVFAFAPRWAELWFTLYGPGVVTSVVLMFGVVLALVVKPDRLVACLALPIALLLAFYIGVARVALPFYYYAWMPFLIALSALGYSRLAGLRPRLLTGAVVAVALVALVPPSVGLSRNIWLRHLTGIALVPRVLAEHGVDSRERILFSGCPAVCYVPYFGDRGTVSVKHGPFGAIVMGKDPRVPLPASAARLLSERPDAFQRFKVDDLVILVPNGDLVYARGALTVR